MIHLAKMVVSSERPGIKGINNEMLIISDNAMAKRGHQSYQCSCDCLIFPTLSMYLKIHYNIMIGFFGQGSIIADSLHLLLKVVTDQMSIFFSIAHTYSCPQNCCPRSIEKTGNLDITGKMLLYYW